MQALSRDRWSAPPKFIIGTGDLRPVSSLNRLLKYADDSYLLIGSRNACSTQDDISHITTWATRSIFISTHLKPGRWWLYARGAFKTAEPPIAGGKRNSTMNFVGVTINERLSVSDHVSNILGSCSSSTFALRTLRSRGMPRQALHDVTRANTLARMLYASPTWWGLLNEADLNHLESFLRRTRRGGFLPDEVPTFKTT